jgi:D-lactate dehydrogenase
MSDRMLHRYVMFSIAPRYLLMHPKRAGSEITLDVALPRNAEDWTQAYPDAVEGDIFCALTAAHFLCHVFHWSLLLKPDSDKEAVREKILQAFDARGAEYPAEHNVGHLYEAKPVLKAFYETLDPTRTFNPGIGGTPKQRSAPVARPAQSQGKV